jgi:ABC-type multidrug transport system permease subunit
MIAVGSANMAMASTLRSFPKEKAIVSGEMAAKMYDTLPYFIGKALSDIPQTAFFNSLFGLLASALTGLSTTPKKLRYFLGLNTLHTLTAQSAGLLIGAISPSSDTALAMFPAIMVLNIIFDGRNISEENTPRLLRWIPKVGLIRWGYEGLCVNEFEGLEFDTSGPIRGPVAKTGADALARFGLADKKVGVIIKAQLYITSACWFLSYLGLKLTRQKFQVMEPLSKVNGNGKKNGKKQD